MAIDLTPYRLEVADTDHVDKFNNVLSALEAFINLPGASAWLTATAYSEWDYVSNGGRYYVCLVAHTSGTFATDLAAGKWALMLGDYPGVTDNATGPVLILADDIVKVAGDAANVILYMQNLAASADKSTYALNASNADTLALQACSDAYAYVRDLLTFTHDGAISQPAGRLGIGVAASSSFTVLIQGAGTEYPMSAKNSAGTGMFFTGAANLTMATGASGANAACSFNKDSTTSRSVNAAGTVNASGADYAEYEKLAPGTPKVAKGDIVGFDADGNITTLFSKSISFAIKSTDPSYVGGDAWGREDVIGPRPELLEVPKPTISEEMTDAEKAEILAEYEAAKIQATNDHIKALVPWEEKLEVERQKVDRIAYAGKVPVNDVIGNPGDYVVPAEGAGDTIESISVSPGAVTFEQSLIRVGQIKSIGADGRAVVIVKMG